MTGTRVLVAQHRYTDFQTNTIEWYVNCGIIEHALKLEDRMTVSLLEIPPNLYEEIEHRLRQKGFTGPVYCLSTEALGLINWVRADKPVRISVFEQTPHGFKYRKLLKEKQKISYELYQ
jgi:hypothetical protein